MLSKFSINQRMIILVALAGSIAGLIAVALWTQQPDMQVLFTNLNPEDAAGIVDKLKETKVPYETTGGGATILVPSAQVHELRLQLATQGLPHGGGVGFEIFDRSSIGMSDFVQKLNYRRALQGELARTIAQMPEIERARVHLATPERRLFSNDENRARASVVVSLRNGQALAKTQVNGIVHLVSSSVEGLQVKDVTVVDGHGRLLSSAAGSDDAAGLTGSQLEYQRTVEKDIETRIQTMLERIVGVNKAVVRVSSILDFRKVETTEEKYDPNSQVVRSEQRGQEKATGVNGVSRWRAWCPVECPGWGRPRAGSNEFERQSDEERNRELRNQPDGLPSRGIQRKHQATFRGGAGGRHLRNGHAVRSREGRKRYGEEVCGTSGRRHEAHRRDRQKSHGLFGRATGSSPGDQRAIRHCDGRTSRAGCRGCGRDGQFLHPLSFAMRLGEASFS